MSEQEAMALAIEAMREVAERLNQNERYVKMFEGQENIKVPAEVRRGAERRAALLEAVKVLQARELNSEAEKSVV